MTVSGWKELEQLKEMDYIAVPRELIFWGKEALPDYKLRLLGYLISEGGITKGVTFTNYDRDMLKDFEQCAIAMGDKVTKIKYTDGQLLHVRKNIPYSHTIPNYTEKWLRKLGLFGKKSSGKFIPDIIFSLNKKDVALFLRTLFTGDGHVCSGPHGEEVGYGSMSEKLVRQVQHLLLRFGIVSTVKSKITSYGTTGWGVAIRDKDNVIKFINTIGFLFSKGEKARIICDKLSGTKRRRGFMDIFPGEYSKTINSYIVRPKTRAWYRQLSLRWLEQSLRTGGTLNRGVVQDIAGIINNGELNKMAYSDILWDRIEKIEYCGVEQTYDLCLQNNHNFVANDIIVHNSFFLLETAFQSVINGVKCLFISLEMSADEVWERFIKRITSCGEQEGNIFYPTFDCLRNQDGSCTIKQRINQVKLLKDGMFKPEPGKEPAGYKSCSICRSDYKGGKNHPYIPETWFEGIKRERLDYAMVLKKISGINRMYNMNKIFRVLTFPTHSTNLAKMEIHLKQWEDSDGWMPDVIVIDYADILAPEDNRESGRDRIDNTWKELKRIASSRRCVVATATQANRASIEKFMVKQIHASEDIRKVAHVDVMLSLNQTPWEKSAGAMRIGVVAHRHKGFLETESVTILQNLSVGQSLLDSEFGVVESFMERKKE